MTHPGPNDIVVLHTIIDQDDAALSPRRMAELTLDERHRLNRFRNISDRARFLIGRSLMRYGLRTLFGIERGELDFGPHGKPQLADSAHADITVSLSHSVNVVACAFARNASIGLDVEAMGNHEDIATAGSQHLAADERAYLRRLPTHQQNEVFVRLWTLKEAVAKATGLGLQLSLDSFVVALNPVRLISAGAEIEDIPNWRLYEKVIGDVRFATVVRRDHHDATTVAYRHVALDRVYANAVV